MYFVIIISQSNAVWRMEETRDMIATFEPHRYNSENHRLTNLVELKKQNKLIKTWINGISKLSFITFEICFNLL